MISIKPAYLSYMFRRVLRRSNRFRTRVLERLAGGRNFQRSALKYSQGEHELSFNLDVPLRSYLDYAMPLSILAKDKAYLPVLLSYNVQVFFPDSMLGLAEGGLGKFLMCPGLNNWQWMKLGYIRVEAESKYDARRVDRAKIVADLATWLGEGNYIETRLNEYYLPCRGCFLRKHHLHINLVVGINVQAGTVLLAGYNEDYTLSTVNIDDFLDSFIYIGSRSLRSTDTAGLRFKRMIWKWRKIDRVFPPQIDLELVVDQLMDYVSSRSSLHRRIIATDDELAFPAEAGRWGLESYDSWIIYLDRVARGQVTLDLRATRTFWEHKRCMAMRIDLLRKTGIRISGDLSDLFRDIEEKAKAIRFCAFSYSVEQKPQSMKAIKKGIQSTREKEAEVYPRLIETLLSQGVCASVQRS